MVVKTHNTSKAPGDDCKATQMPWLQCGVLSGASFPVIPVTNHNPLDSSPLVITSGSGNSVIFTGLDVPNFVGLRVFGIDSTNKHVVGDVVEMSPVF